MVLMVMESLIWSFMACMILCGLVWFSIVYYANVFPFRSQMVLFGYMWSCMALRSYAQFLCLFLFSCYDRYCVIEVDKLDDIMYDG